MLTPLTTPQTPAEQSYQETQILMRNAMERLFGVWKRRFPVLATGMQINIKTVLSIIVGCAVLHNVAVNNNDNGEGFNQIEADDGNELINVRMLVWLIINSNTNKGS